MAARWPVGHRATRFAEWAAPESRALFLGPLRFEPLFEPYVIVAVALCPPFDEGLSGYGRNKALHAVSGDTSSRSLPWACYYLSALSFSAVTRLSLVSLVACRCSFTTVARGSGAPRMRASSTYRTPHPPTFSRPWEMRAR